MQPEEITAMATGAMADHVDGTTAMHTSVEVLVPRRGGKTTTANYLVRNVEEMGRIFATELENPLLIKPVLVGDSPNMATVWNLFGLDPNTPVTSESDLALDQSLIEEYDCFIFDDCDCREYEGALVGHFLQQRDRTKPVIMFSTPGSPTGRNEHFDFAMELTVACNACILRGGDALTPCGHIVTGFAVISA